MVRQPEGRAILVSLKWQQVGGTAEQKVPFEIMCLAQALRDRATDFERAYVVLGGGGWKLREFYVGGGLRDYLCNVDLVAVLTLEQFVARANNGDL